MLTNSDFRELLNLFEKHETRYLIVGGYAVMKYSEPRFPGYEGILSAFGL